MEYYIYLTYDCNLRCSYCSARSATKASNGFKLTDGKIQEVIDYISANSDGRKDSLVFFGGEPLLECETINRFIENTRHLQLEYLIYTNGLLLDRVPDDLLNKFDVMFVSIDGDKRAHEKHRGAGTYNKIINNLKSITSKIDVFLIGRITVEEETRLFVSVRNVADYVDAVYWQVVNKPIFNDSAGFVNRYKSDLSKLFDYWLANLRKGNLINIIPFQAVISHLIFNRSDKNSSFRCGAGSSLEAIDIEGNIYWCDEYIRDPRGIIGHVNDGKTSNYFKTHGGLFQDCEQCCYNRICLGRCRKMLTEYSKKQIRVYCDITKYLIELIESNIREVESLIHYHKYNSQTFYDVPRCTEEIP